MPTKTVKKPYKPGGMPGLLSFLNAGWVRFLRHFIFNRPGVSADFVKL